MSRVSSPDPLRRLASAFRKKQLLATWAISRDNNNLFEGTTNTCRKENLIERDYFLSLLERRNHEADSRFSS